jgi:putative phosphoesterase
MSDAVAFERIGILSDIHGNLVAFEAVLAALRAEGIERLVCLGDVAASGPQPREVVQRLRALRCPVVMGNADEEALNPPEPAAGADEDMRRIREINRWTAAQLSADEREFVAGFSSTVTILLADGGSVLCYHGSPQSYDDMLLPTTPAEELDTLLGDAAMAATVLAGGHTHQQMLRRHHKALVINPGSVGLAFDRVPPGPGTRNPSWAEYAVLTDRAGDLRIELRRARFDGVALVAAARASGMPHAEWYASDWDTA